MMWINMLRQSVGAARKGAVLRSAGARTTAGVGLALGIALGTPPSAAHAAMILDLTTVGSQGMINGAIYQQLDMQPTGTGNIDSFVQLSPQGNGTTSSAYNTTVNNTLDNGSSDNFNRSIFVSDIPLVTLDTVIYGVFLLDINEADAGPSNDRFVSLDEVQIFVGGTANSSVETFTGGILDHDGTLVYQMDAGMDNWVALDFQLNSGSGSGDMFLYLPYALLNGFDGSDVVTLYSEFGQQGVDPAGLPTGDYGQSGGFEEWALPVPEPASALFMAVGLAGLTCRRR